MDGHFAITLSAIFQQMLAGLSRSMVLFIVASGLSLVLGVLRIPNLAHGSLYMLGAFFTYSVMSFFNDSLFGFCLALVLAPLAVALISFIIERGLFRHLYDREHLMLLLFTFAFTLVFSDLVKIIYGSEYRSVAVPGIFRGSFEIFGLLFPKYNLFLLAAGPIVALGLWFLVNRTKIGRMARAAAVDREMTGAMGINVGMTFSAVFVTGCLLAGLGGALVAPMQNITQGMDHSIIMETFLIVIIGGLGNMRGAFSGALIFGLADSMGILIWPQFAIVFPYAAVIIILLFRPRGLLKSTW